MRLTVEEKEIVEKFKEKVQARYPEELVHLILFGSKVRGDAGPESDIDLLVVIRSDDWKRGDQIRELGYPLEWEHGVVLSIQVIGQRHFDRLREVGSHFLKEVEREGVVV